MIPLLELTLLLLSVPSSGKADTGTDGKARVQLALHRTEVTELEPLLFEVVYTCESESGEMDVFEYLHPDTTNVEIRRSADAPWTSAHLPRMDYIRRTFAPMEPTKGTMICSRVGRLRFCTYGPPRFHRGENGARSYTTTVPRFADPGTYQIRALYQYDEGRWVDSGPVEFTVVELTGVDARARDLLKQHHRPEFPFTVLWQGSWPISSYLGEDASRISSELIERYPASRFAPWAELCVAYNQDVFTQAEAPESRKARAKVRALYDDLTNDIRLREAAAEFLRDRGEIVEIPKIDFHIAEPVVEKSSVVTPPPGEQREQDAENVPPVEATRWWMVVALTVGVLIVIGAIVMLQRRRTG